MKTLCSLLFVAALLIQCTKGSEKAVVENAPAVQDTVTQAASEQTTEPEEEENPNKNFPKYVMDLYSRDTLEEGIRDEMTALLATYDSMDFRTITADYYRERTYLENKDSVNESEEVAEAWYIDSNFEIRAYSKTYFRYAKENDQDYKVAIYLFSNDSLIAMIDHWEQFNAVGVAHRKRMMADKCPTCGVYATAEAYSDDSTLQYLTEDDFAEAAKVADTRMSEMLEVVKTKWFNGKEHDGHRTITVELKGTGKFKGVNCELKYATGDDMFDTFITR